MAMRILHVIPFYAPAWMYGGPVRTTLEVTRRLAQRGHRVAVFTTDVFGGGRFPEPVGRPVMVDGVEITYFRHAGGSYSPYFSPTLGKALARRIGEFDIVHASVGFAWTGAQVRRHALAARVPYIYHAHDAMDPIRWRSKRLMKILCFALFERRVLRDASGLVALTPFEAQDYRRRGADPSRIAVIPNGVDVQRFAPGAERGAFRSRYGLAPDEPLIAYVGRLERVKGLDRLLEAFRLTREEVPHARLVLAGPDEGMRPRLEEQARRAGLTQSLLFTGPIEEEQVRALLAGADVFALFSTSEGLPVSVLEALAMGCPAVISEESHVPQVQTAGAGAVIANGDVAAFARALVHLLTDPAARSTAAGCARALAQREFTWDAALDKIEQLYLRAKSEYRS